MAVIRKSESVARMSLPSRVSDVEGVSDPLGVVAPDSLSLTFGRSFATPTFGSLIIGNKDRIVGKSRDDAAKCSIASVYFCCSNRY